MSEKSFRLSVVGWSSFFDVVCLGCGSEELKSDFFMLLTKMFCKILLCLLMSKTICIGASSHSALLVCVEGKHFKILLLEINYVQVLTAF